MAINKEALDARITRLESFVRNLDLENALQIKKINPGHVQELLQKVRDVDQLIRVIDQQCHAANSLYRLEVGQFRGAEGRFDRQRVAQSRDDKLAYLNAFDARLRGLFVYLVNVIAKALAGNDPTDHSGKNPTQLMLEGTNELESFAKLLEKLEQFQAQVLSNGIARADFVHHPAQNQCLVDDGNMHKTQTLVPAEIKRLQQVNQPTVSDALVAIVVCLRILIMILSKPR